MKIFINNFFDDMSLKPLYSLFNNVFNENIEIGNFENSDILFESVFGSNTLLYKKKWLYTFLFIGEPDRRLPLFLQNVIKDFSCVLKGKNENDVATNVINFPLYVFYSDIIL
jgi:hypothetical protein